MENSKLIRVLKTFSKDDWKEFKKFVSSAYFNKGRNYLPLLKELRKHSPDFLPGKLTRKALYRALYPDKSYKDSVILTLLSKLHRLTYEFMLQKGFLKSDSIKKQILIDELTKRSLHDEAEQIIKETEDFYKSKKHSYTDYMDRLLIYDRFHDHYFLRSDRYKTLQYRIEFIKYIIYHCLLEVLIASKELSRSRTFLKSSMQQNYLRQLFKCIDINKLYKLIRGNEKDNMTVLQLYYDIYNAYKFPENEYFYYKLKKASEENITSLDEDMKKRIYANLSAICSSYAIKGKTKFHEELFSIQVMLLNENLYTEPGGGNYLSSNKVRNIIITALYLKKYKFLEDFVENYIDKVDPESRESLLHYCHAKISYVKGDLKSSLFHATKVEQKNLLFKLDIKSLLCEIYYDTGSTESLLSLLDTYYHLVKNADSQNSELITRHLNFIQCIKKLTHLRENDFPKAEFIKFKNRVDKLRLISNKSWLVEKINEIT